MGRNKNIYCYLSVMYVISSSLVVVVLMIMIAAVQLQVYEELHVK